MKLDHKNCVNCGHAFDNSEKGMTAKVWAGRKCCSRKCGAIYRNAKPVEVKVIAFDTETALFRFVSGLSMMELMASN